MQRLLQALLIVTGVLMIVGCMGFREDRLRDRNSHTFDAVISVEIDSCMVQMKPGRGIRDGSVRVYTATVLRRCSGGESSGSEVLWRLDSFALRSGRGFANRRYLFWADVVARSRDFVPLMHSIARRIDAESMASSESFRALAPAHRRQILEDGLLRLIAIAPSRGDTDHADPHQATFAMADGARIVLETDAEDGRGWWAQIIE
jgi:hypothetical protein